MGAELQGEPERDGRRHRLPLAGHLPQYAQFEGISPTLCTQALHVQMLSSRPPAFLDYLPGGELSGEALATPPRTSATAFATGHNGNKRRGLWRHWLTFGAAGPGRPGRPSLPFIHASASENTRDPRCVFWPPKMCGMTLREPRLLDILLLEKKFPCRVADKAGWLLQGQARGPRMLSPALLSEAGVRPDARGQASGAATCI